MPAMATSEKQRIFMTGANGYVGSVITEFAIAEGYSVVGLSRSEASDEKLRGLGATPVRGDIQTFDVLTRESGQADIVIHLVDTLREKQDRPYSEVVRDSNAAIDAIAKGLKGSGKPLITTSGSLVTAADPNGDETDETSPLWEKPTVDRISSEKYGLAQCDKDIKVSAIRLAPFVYGRSGSGVRLFMMMAANAGEVTYVDQGSARVTTVHVDDAARLYLLAAKNARAGEAYNGTYETDVTFRDVAEAIGQVLELQLKSIPYKDAASSMGEFFAKFLSTENRGSNSKAVRELGWKPKEKGLVEEVTSGTYVKLAQSLRKHAA